MSYNLNKLDVNVKRRIIRAANTIRKKYLALKLERGEEDETLNKFLKPISEPLNKLVEKSAEKPRKFKKIKIEKREPVPIPEPVPKPVPEQVRFLPTETIASTRSEDEEEEEEVFSDPINEPLSFDDELETTLRKNPVVYESFIEQYPEAARGFVENYFQKSNVIDITHGLKYDNITDSWKMGSVRVKFQKDGDIEVDNKSYLGSPGLYSLLFLKNPSVYNRYDQDNYQEILNKSGVYRNSIGTIKGDRSAKYQNIVRPLLTASSQASRLKSPSIVRSSSISGYATRSTTSKTGQALLEYTEKPKFIYYDDVNELVARFMKLEASKDVGNNNNREEIMCILKELERLGVIEFYK